MSINDLVRFSASSANDDNYKNLWYKGASLYIDQLNTFLKYTDYKLEIIDVSKFENSDSVKLGDVLKKHKSDKSTGHNYHILYSYIFNELGRENHLKVFEIGLGTNNPHLVSSMGEYGRPGASLYSWEEYLPNAQVYGADIDKDILFNTERIRTHVVDQLDKNSFVVMQKEFDTKYDLIIDDGLHSIGANLNTLLFALENVNMGGWIVIEDISVFYADNWFTIDYMLKSNKNYECFFIKTHLSFLYVVHKLD